MQKKKVVFLLGPTAVGKSAMAVEIAKKFDGEIISADSVQVFQGLDIGSGKISKVEMQNIPHHCIDILKPEEQFSVFDFVNLTKTKIDEILSRGRLPIIVGGTGLYVKSLTLGYNFGGAQKDEKTREDLQKLAAEKGNQYLFDMLQNLDSEMAAKTDKHNTVRLVRALEIAQNHGKKSAEEVDIDPLLLALTKPREALYAAINARVEGMIKSGLVEEVKNLKSRGLSKENQSMHAIGYKEVLDFLDGQCDEQKMAELIKQHSRNYAKRQMTFLRGMENVVFVDMSDSKKAQKVVFGLVSDFLAQMPLDEKS